MPREVRAPRFFIDPTAALIVAGQTLELPAAVARHAAQVLRLRTGDAVVVFSGSGGEYDGALARIDKRGVTIAVDRHHPIERELETPLTLVQALVATDMMDLIVRKAVELGASTIVPVLAQRSQSLSDERADKRLAHWRQVAIAACEQCGRNRVPRVAAVQLFADWLAQTKVDEATVALLPQARLPLAQVAAQAPIASVAVGPEGGFTEDEAAALARAGARAASLGARVLRAETATIAALAIVTALSDNKR